MFYKEKTQSDGSLDKLKLRILVRGDFQNKDMIEYNRTPIASMMTLKYFLSDDSRENRGTPMVFH